MNNKIFQIIIKYSNEQKIVQKNVKIVQMKQNKFNRDSSKTKIFHMNPKIVQTCVLIRVWLEPKNSSNLGIN